MIKLNKNITFNFIWENSRLPRSVQTKFRRKAGIHLFAIDLDKNMAEYLVKFMCST